MKIVQINSCNFGSTGNIMLQIASIAEKQMHIVYCCYPKRRSNNNSGRKSDIIIGGILGRNISSFFSFTGREDLFYKHATRKFLRKIEKINPDIIHLHNIHGSYINYKLLFTYIDKNNIKVIWTFHDCWPITGHCTYFNIIGCQKWKTQCFNCPLISQYPKTFVDRSEEIFNLKRKYFNSVQKMILAPVSSWLSDIIKDSFLSKYPIEITHNGIDLDIFRPSKTDGRKRYGIERKFVIVAVASVWSNDKGFNDYIELSKLLDSDYVIILVGLDKSRIAELPHNILGIEKTSNQKELAGIYSMADVVCSLSYSETFGLTIVEGIACGTPAIVYNNTAQKYLVDEQVGRVVETGDVVAVKDSIFEIKKMSDGERHQMRKSCIDRVHSEYDRNVSYNRYVEIYNKLFKESC